MYYKSLLNLNLRLDVFFQMFQHSQIKSNFKTIYFNFIIHVNF